MAVSKVAYDGRTLIDLTSDTAVESDVASGKYFHKADGSRVQGTASHTTNLQNKTVSLGSAAPSAVSADTGYDGLGTVSFNTSGIDASKIRTGYSVCGVPGNYEGIIPTGTLPITSNGTYDVSAYASAEVSVSANALFDHRIIYGIPHGSSVNLGWRPTKIVLSYGSYDEEYDPQDPDHSVPVHLATHVLTGTTDITGDGDMVTFTSTGYTMDFEGTSFNDFPDDYTDFGVTAIGEDNFVMWQGGNY